MTPAEFRFTLPGGDELVARAGAVVAVCAGDESGADALARQVAERITSGVSPVYAWIDRRRGLVPALDVAENIFMGHERRRARGLFRGGIDWKRTRDDAASLLAGLGSTLRPVDRAGDAGEFDRLVIEIARAEARGASVVALDEPSARLSPAETIRLLEVLSGLALRGAAVLVVTQRPAEALGYADELVVLRGGAIVGAHPRSSWSGAAEGGAAGAEARDAVRDRVLAELVGPTDARPAAPATPPSPGSPLLRVTGWSTFDPVEPERALVSDAALEVRAGEIVGIAGLRDSGAESLLLSVYGRSEGTGTTGAVELDGRPVDTSTVEKAIAAGLFLATTSAPRYRVRFVGGIAMPVSASKLPALVSLGLVDRDSDTAPREGLGATMLGAARALGKGGDEAGHIRGLVAAFPASDRRVLLLGEPFRGSTEAQRAEILSHLEAARAAGKAVAIASADLPALLALCDRVVTMAAGRVTGEVRAGADPAALGALLAPG
ncbi:sugar ABC transporter ATP-binding protein [Herbiconiux flava]|uniref:ABC-type sugar transport system ATPase subunit n=1 Tax=Herbiconiux flava TaxID=881268 RepID=A0A852SJX2_9MICO|nr:sugar ABC transporter ATP-binding protein [Herbiconiux flava]NYD69005.1 ABC-type sugar transport system ATPase subunit [Herbiconiux flava]GLK15753.1 xylose ABC transporter ATP-binding protein [Herbiconiux flava]